MREDYASYAAAFYILEIDTLEDRRIKISENFARKSILNIRTGIVLTMNLSKQEVMQPR